MLRSTPTAAPTLYGLRRPTLADARAALGNVFGPAADDIWNRFTRHLGKADEQTALVRLIEAMRSDGDPVVALCGQSLLIRYTTFDRLTEVHDTIRSAE